jgi:hypothetical protein
MLVQNQKKYYLLYIFLLFLLAAYHFIRWPIVATDTDLWYHLNGGRYILENMSLPHASFFSFISPPREWIDYYWLFQVIAYKLHSLSGYYGLIVIRTLLYLSIAYFIFKYIFQKSKEDISYLYPLTLFLLYFLLFMPRYLNLRPYTFSYLFIVSFLYILECKPRRAFLLPIIAVFWTNLHGIEYPVMILICLSYLIDPFWSRIRSKTPFTKKELSYVVPIVISMGAIFLTPHGPRLLQIPFESIEYVSRYISELKQLGTSDFLSYHIDRLAPEQLTVFNVLLAISCLAIITALLKRSLRMSHLLLFMGGSFLLLKGIRFIYEFSLLALPVVVANPLLSRFKERTMMTKLVSALTLVVLIVMPYMYVKNTFTNRPRYPFSYRNLPYGITAFLKRIDVGGTVLNSPNNGGFLQWALYPDYKIFADMEVPFLFTFEDHHYALNSFHDEHVLRKFIAEYGPSFITVPIKNVKFSKMIKHIPDYSFIFFDDYEVLYVNGAVFPDIAREYALKIDPFVLATAEVGELKEMSDEDIGLFLNELMILNEIYPDHGMANRYMGMIYNKKRQYNQAMSHAERLIDIFPESRIGYELKADSLMGLRLFNDAVSHYYRALERSDDIEAQRIYRRLLLCFYSLKEYNLYFFGLTALKLDRTTEARMFFQFADLKVPPDDQEWKRKMQEHLSRFITDEAK